MSENNSRTVQRSAIVTGSAGGIGKGIVERLVSDGFQVTIADVNFNGAQQLAADLNAGQTNPVAHAVHLDVTDESSVERAISETVAHWGRLDVLSANAGIYPMSELESVSQAEWDQVLNVNLRGGLFCLKHAVPHMRKQGYGRVIFTSSVTGEITGVPGFIAYGASKAGILGMMRSAALEVVKDGITVNAVMPGNVKTAAWDELPEEYLQSTLAGVPMGRLAEPSDVANGVSFFADERSSYVTGHGLIIDGGQILPETMTN